MEIERAHRLGAKRHDAEKPRPLIARFLDFKDKMAVKEGRVNLSRDLGISEDLPFAIRQARRRLHDDLEKAKSEGKVAWISYPARLFVDYKEVRAEPVRVAEADSERGGWSDGGRDAGRSQQRDNERGRQQRRHNDKSEGNRPPYNRPRFNDRRRDDSRPRGYWRGDRRGDGRDDRRDDRRP